MDKIVKSFFSKEEKVIFRYLHPKDVKDWRLYYNSLIDEGAFTTHKTKMTEKMANEWIEKHLGRIKRKAEACLVVEINSKVVGYAEIDIEESKEALRLIGDLGMGLRKEARGRGIGEKLLRAVITEAKKVLHIKIVELDAFADNLPAVNLYKKCGFELAYTLKKAAVFHGKRLNRIHMVKYL